MTISSKNHDDFLQHLDDESERGMILIYATALEVQLANLLWQSFEQSKHAEKTAIKPLFASMAPLSSFSAKIKMSYALNLITKTQFNNLERIRAIRNIAAHEQQPTTFQSEKINKICEKLEEAGQALEKIFDDIPNEKKRFEINSELAKCGSKELSDKKNQQLMVAKKAWVERYRFEAVATFMVGGLAAVNDFLREQKKYGADALMIVSKMHRKTQDD